ncbi:MULTISPECIES: Ig-like domain-containing protein [Microbacterium]|uniref:Ig-like domain-containing protein n=1 Tax=Microbacterium TaxID=33882 RepID=UPI00146A2B46|nr:MULTISPECIES: Ig-like domain-containing protein [Microbacterium]
MRRSTAGGLIATAAVVAVVIGAGVVWPGLDAQETPDVDTAVWALQTGDGRRYARVNTSVGELDTVRGISNPDQVVQTDDAAYIFSDSFSKVTRIDEALPTDLDEQALRASASTPAGTTDVVTAGDFVAYRTEVGGVFAGLLSRGEPAQVDPFPSGDEDAPRYAADAIALDERGILFAYSRDDGSVVRYDIRTGAVAGRDALEADGLSTPAVTAAGDVWAVIDTDDGDVWLRGGEGARRATATGAVIAGKPDADGTAVYLADETGLVRIPADGSDFDVAAGGTGTVLGTPAQPVVHDDEVFAAWLGQGDGGGWLWRSSDSSMTPLDYGDGDLADQRRPVFVASERAIILNETRSGWAWSVPDGGLIPSSQDWSLDDRIDPDAVPSEEQLPVVLDPKPPIAEPDAFGLRPGSLTTLPVLMNDHDPNEDVLSIDPASVTGLDPGFGSVSITDDGQRLAVRATPQASGSATFSYAVTDGTSQGGLLSKPTTVTLTAAGASADSAPQWCGVERCLVEWPQPEVARGGTVTVPVLPGWVDPEGDPLLLLAVENPSGIGSVAATPSGDVVYQHSDDGGGGEELVELIVTIADTRGQATEKSLLVRVSPEPQLYAQSFAVVDTVGSLTVDVADHVTGTAGTLTLDSVRVLDDAAATATVVDGSTEFDFSASAAGTFRVDFTVTDGVTDANGTARITLLPADAPADLATSPVVAFVRPQQDATLDVFAAVSNPTRRVLLLSDVVATADEGASLSVDAVGQNNLRVSGTTATGAAGRLGTVSYVVSDGTDDRGSRVEGEATVYLLPPAPELAPIAVDDTIVVRAGAQIDIPVLANDISPAGGRPILNPASVASSTDEALAFASGELLRYLAPTEPGDYGIDYSVFTTGAPALADTATVRVRVLADDTNRAPLPDTLEGRVLSGQSTLIEFDGFGMDPDGDVVTLDRIVAQPERGAAAISADGASILYSSVPGDSGQASFRYRVVDAFGEAGEATVRIGVLDGQANPSPVTFTDYVQVQAGNDSTIRVSPLANDVDPTLGSLAITEVRPDLPPVLMDGSDNPEFDRLDDRILSVNDSTVVIAAGAEPTTMSFLYDIESSSGNTGRGLIVVDVVRESVPDYPVVADTILTAETREDFPEGVDVLADKATWSGGDLSDLTVSLWNPEDGVSVDGWRLSGDLPARTRLIPFAVTGEGASGEVTTYAFLRVPGDDDLALALRAGIVPPEVTELESISFDMDDLVAKPRGARLEVGEGVRVSGARTGASCVFESGSVVRYDAGPGAPWVDSCQVPVRLEGQDDWTHLSVPITVNALDPQPVLRPASMTVGPGETATFDLRDMTSWQLRQDWGGIAYALDYAGSAFDVSVDGSTVTVTGADDAVPGREEAALVSVTSHSLVSPARLILRVGAAPSTLPQGGSAVQQCSQAAGSSCTIDVIGAGGEVNPLPRTPLEVVSVRPTGACVGVGFQVGSATSVVATWTQDAPGATCTASFSVRDAQGRVTNAERDGRVLLDLQGFPKAPASIAQTAYGDGTVTLRVDPGGAALAYPALAGFVVRSGGQEVARCSAEGVCPDIRAPNGDQRTYEAWAVNAVGESKTSVRTVAWAYDAPGAPSGVTWTPVVTGGEGGIVALVIDGVDTAETGILEITSPAGETLRVPVGRGDERVEVRSYRVGSNTSAPVTITPYSRFSLPPGLGGQPSGQSVTVYANGVGAPLNVALSLTSRPTGGDQATVDAVATAQPNGTGSQLRYAIVPYDERSRCTPEVGGDRASFPGLAAGEEHRFFVCVESWYDDTVFGRSSAEAAVRATQTDAAPRGYTFVVDRRPVVEGQEARWRIVADPTSGESPPRNNEVHFEGWGPGTAVYDRDPGIRVYYRHRLWGTESQRGTVTPAPGSAPYQVFARWGIDSCVAGAPLGRTWTSSNGDGAFAWSDERIRFLDENGAALPYTAGSWTVPAGATSVEGVEVTVSWNAAWNLDPTTQRVSAACDPGDPPGP